MYGLAVVLSISGQTNSKNIDKMKTFIHEIGEIPLRKQDLFQTQSVPQIVSKKSKLSYITE